MTPITEEQLREIAEREPNQSLGSRYNENIALARQCLDLMKANIELRENVEDWFAKYRAVERECDAALARAEAAEARLRETIDTPPYDHDEWDELICAWCNQPGQHEDWCLYTRISAHFATVPQQTRKECDPPSEMTTAVPLPQPASYSPAPEASVSGAEIEAINADANELHRDYILRMADAMTREPVPGDSTHVSGAESKGENDENT